ncbi:hypothetical protein Syun_019500 [Stephania yunnanensis]|uniref:Uncharacterized protein n=1 Tax=Stephania yunnanensis TaxID=152371 RepID=A0AAP0NWR4_9MAGN
MMKTETEGQDGEKVKNEMNKEAEVVVVMEVQVEVKMVPLKNKRKEVQVGEIMKRVKVKREKIPKKSGGNEA